MFNFALGLKCSLALRRLAITSVFAFRICRIPRGTGDTPVVSDTLPPGCNDSPFFMGPNTQKRQ